MTKPSVPLHFPFAKGTSEGLDWNRTQVENLHLQFLAQWRQSLSALVPADVHIHAGELELKTYQQFVVDAQSQADIQVFEIDALQSLCAWILDTRWVTTAVDCMFGGAGRIPVRDLSRRMTPIELGVRQRLLESLATAYEAAWQAVYPIRLQPLRQEQQLSSLRMGLAQDSVLHAKFALVFNRVEMQVDLCLPRRALEELSPSRLTSTEDAKPAAWSRSLQHQLNSTPVESIAVLCEKELTVAQLLSLSIGQVLPIDLVEPVRLMVDGVSLLSGRYGVRNGHYAIKVEQVNEQHAARDLASTPAGVSPEAADWEVPPKAQADLMAAAEAMNQLVDQIQKNEGAM